MWDATAADPKLLVFLKSYRNTVPVPRHWCQKRKFLQVSHRNGTYIARLIIVRNNLYPLLRMYLVKIELVDRKQGLVYEGVHRR